jgi:glyoxylase-like metal-dependent hydrolase (beta-lactamase superfamily II)
VSKTVTLDWPSGQALLAHAEAVPRLSGGAAFGERAWAFLFDTVRQAGAPVEPLARRIAAMRQVEDPRQRNVLFRGGKEQWTEPVQVTRTVAEGQFVTQGREAWQVVCLPGHAPGLIGLYRPETADLIVSDHLLPDTSSAPGVYMPSEEGQPRHPYMTDYLASLRRVAEMSVRTAGPAERHDPDHQPPGPVGS